MRSSVNAARPGSGHEKEYGHLLRDDPIYAEKAKRFSSIVKDAAQCSRRSPPALVGKLAPSKMTVTYQDPLNIAATTTSRTSSTTRASPR